MKSRRLAGASAAGAWWSIVAATVASAADAPVSTLPSSSAFGTLLQVVFGLAVVLGAIALTAWLVRRYMPAVRGAGGLVKVVGGAMVGPKERVVVVEVGETWLVLGVTTQQVNSLHTLPRPANSPTGSAAAHPGADFSTWLGRARKKPPI